MSSEEFRNIFGVLFFTFCFGYGLNLAIGGLLQTKRFVNSTKYIDLTEWFGNFGRVLYFILGLSFSVLSFLMILKFLGVGPFVGLK